MRKALLFFLILCCSTFAAATGPTSSIVGQLATPTGGAVVNGTLSFTLSQPALISGTASIVPQTSSCYTTAGGSVVGIPDPLALPVVTTNTSSGTLTAGTYYVKITYTGAGGQSLPSPETTIVLTGLGSIIVNPPVIQPASATGWKIYIGSSSGSETLQGSYTGGFGSQYTQSAPLAAGAALPVTNSSTCFLWFSDSMIPTGTFYSVNLLSQNGTQMAGYPQTWCTYGGAAGVIDISQGAPTGNCGQNGVFYPTPIFANPPNNGQQSISGPLALFELTGDPSFTGRPTYKGPSPYYDVTDPAYGALCNGSADDTAAINLAITAASIGGATGIIYIPSGTSGCVIAGSLTFDNTSNISLQCGSGPYASEVGLHPALVFTGTPAALISAKSTVGFSITNCDLIYTNAAFNGMMVDLEHSGTGGDSSNAVFYGNSFVGNSSAKLAVCAICGDKANSITVDRNHFAFLVTAVRGSTSSSYANVWKILNNEFGSTVGPISGPFIMDLKDGTYIIGNNFEFPTGPIFQSTNVVCEGCVFAGNAVEDTTAAYNPTNALIDCVGGGGAGAGCVGMHITGNLFFGGSSKLATLIALTTGSSGVIITGNRIWNWAQVASYASVSTATGSYIFGNSYVTGTVTSLLGGSAPAQGMIEDMNGLVTWYGNGGQISYAGGTVNAGTCAQAGTVVLNNVVSTRTRATVTISGALPASWQTGIDPITAVASNTITVWLCNGTAGNITLAAATLNVGSEN